MEHDKLNLPWKFDKAQGYKTLPVVIWIKKEGDRRPGLTSPGQSQPRWVPFGSSSSGATGQLARRQLVVTMTDLLPQ